MLDKLATARAAPEELERVHDPESQGSIQALMGSHLYAFGVRQPKTIEERSISEHGYLTCGGFPVSFPVPAAQLHRDWAHRVWNPFASAADHVISVLKLIAPK